MEILLAFSARVLLFSTFLLPLSVVLIFIYDKRRNLSFFGKFILLGSVVTLFGFGLMFLINWLIPNEKGMLGLFCGLWIAVFIWAYLLRKYFKLSWVSVTFAAVLPISSLGYYLGFDEFIHRSDKKKEEMNSLAREVKHDFKVFELSIKDYKEQCGQYPTQLEFLYEMPEACKEWEKSVYGDQTTLRDPWGNPYIYSTDGRTNYKITSLGADGKAGGEDFDKDFEFQGPP